MLMTGRDLLAVANKHSFAVPAFNISDCAMCTGSSRSARRRTPPLIVAIHPDELSHIGVDVLPAIIQRAHRSSVPVTIHWDHGGTLRADPARDPDRLHLGDDRRLHAPVRGEHRASRKTRRRGRPRRRPLGRGRARDHRQDRRARPRTAPPTDHLHRPRRGRAVRRATGVDSLAVAIGTCHGIYPSWMKPELKLDLLQEIKSQDRRPARAARRLRQPGRRDRRVGRSSASTRSTSPATSRSPTTTRCARCWRTTGLREPNCHPAAVHRRDEGHRGAEDRPVRGRGQGRHCTEARRDRHGADRRRESSSGLGGTVDYEIAWDPAVVEQLVDASYGDHGRGARAPRRRSQSERDLRASRCSRSSATVSEGSASSPPPTSSRRSPRASHAASPSAARACGPRSPWTSSACRARCTW